jgi:hypothetical protein
LWTGNDIKTVVRDLAGMHAVYLNRPDAVPREVSLNVLSEKTMDGAVSFLSELTSYNVKRFSEMISEDCEMVYHSFLDNMHEHILSMKKAPLTVTHNDFNTRNVCLRKTGEPRLVVYDWEVPCWQNPQHDLIEFMVYAFEANASMDKFRIFSEYYRQELEKASGTVIPVDEFNRILYLNALEIALVRFNLYLLGHNIIKFKFLERVYGNLTNYIVANRHLLG